MGQNLIDAIFPIRYLRIEQCGGRSAFEVRIRDQREDHDVPEIQELGVRI